MKCTCHLKISFWFKHLTFAITNSTHISPLTAKTLPAPIISVSKVSCYICKNLVTNRIAAPKKTTCSISTYCNFPSFPKDI